MEEMLRGSRALGSMREDGPDGPGGPVDGEVAGPRGQYLMAVAREGQRGPERLQSVYLYSTTRV
jgi:hypothetical protein